MRRTKRFSATWCATALLLTIAAATRVALADHSLWFDEQASLFFADQSLTRLWGDWMLRETNPALYYTLLKAVCTTIGTSNVALRSLSIVASLVAIVLIARLARRAYGERAGWYAALLATVSGQHLFFAEQARGYILVLCCLTAATHALLVWCDTDESGAARRRALIVVVIAATTANYLHITALFFLPVALASVVLADPGRYRAAPAALRPLLFALLAIVVLSAWVIRQAALQIADRGDNIAAIGIVGVREIVRESLATLFLVKGAGLPVYGVASAVLALVTWFCVRDWRCPRTRFLLFLMASALGTFASIGLRVPVFVPRTIFWISAVPTVLAAAAIAHLPGPGFRRGVAALLALAVLANSVVVARGLEAEDWDTPVDVLSAHPGAILLVHGEAMALLSQRACRRIRAGECPYVVVAAIDPGDRLDSWASGLFTGPKVPVGDLAAHVGARPVYLFRKADFHNLPVTLHHLGYGRGLPGDGPPLIGPYGAHDLR